MVTSGCWPSSATRPARISSRISRETYLPNISVTRSRSWRPLDHLIEAFRDLADLVVGDHRTAGLQPPSLHLGHGAGERAQRLGHAPRHRDRQPHRGGDAHRHHEARCSTSTSATRRGGRRRRRAHERHARAYRTTTPSTETGSTLIRRKTMRSRERTRRRGTPRTRATTALREERGQDVAPAALGAQERHRARPPSPPRTVVPKMVRRATAHAGVPITSGRRTPQITPASAQPRKVMPPMRKGTSSARRRVSGVRRPVLG